MFGKCLLRSKTLVDSWAELLKAGPLQEPIPHLPEGTARKKVVIVKRLRGLITEGQSLSGYFNIRHGQMITEA